MENSMSLYAKRQAGSLRLLRGKFASDGMGIDRPLGRPVVGRQVIAESCLKIAWSDGKVGQ